MTNDTAGQGGLGLKAKSRGLKPGSRMNRTGQGLGRLELCQNFQFCKNLLILMTTFEK